MTNGPFSLVRHPLYAALIWTLPPLLIIWLEDFIFFIPWTMIIIVSHGVVFIEERGLIDVFGEAYLEYKKTVPALIPFKAPWRRHRRNDLKDLNKN
ncbi:MAG: hypothetical protein JXB26_06240 [Candidatus Aminicenantes bacterium]|nr:hypothetical protein [Candidatus Aminicenantes bacterium]